MVLKQVDDYSGPALIRLKKCGVTNDHLARRLKRALRFRRASVKSKRSKFAEIMSVCLFGLFVISLCVGFFTLIRWIIDLIRSIA